MKTFEQLVPKNPIPVRTPLKTTEAQPQAAPKLRTLLVISADVHPATQQDIAAGRYPRKDYFELSRAFQADILDWAATQDTLMSRLISRALGKPPAQAWLAFHLRHRYDLIYTDSERLGIPL